MASITLVRRSTTYDQTLFTYRMKLEVTSADDITKAVFVKQRLRNFGNGKFDDVFAAVASVAQLHDLDENSPKEGDSYFRDSVVDIVSTDPSFIETVYQDIKSEVQALLTEFEAANALKTDNVTVLTATDIEELPLSTINTGAPGDSLSTEGADSVVL